MATHLAGLLASPVQVAKLVAADGAAVQRPGNRVSIDGDTALIGVPYVDVDGKTDQGAGRHLRPSQPRRAECSWGQVAKLTAPDGGSLRDLFGNVALSARPPTASSSAFHPLARGS